MISGVDPETIRLLASLDHSPPASLAASPLPEGEAMTTEACPLPDQSWGSSLDASQIQRVLSQSVQDNARVLSQTLPGSGSVAANKTLESQHVEELLGCGVNVNDEQELEDLINAVVEEEAESLAMSQCATRTDGNEDGDMRCDC